MNPLILILLVVFAAATRGEEQANALVAKAFNKCFGEFPLGDDEMKEVKDKSTVPSSHNAKCLMACMLKEGRILRGGKYELENAILMADVLNKNDHAAADKAKQLIETCAAQVGTDASADECEFAYKMALCASDEAKKSNSYSVTRFVIRWSDSSALSNRYSGIALQSICRLRSLGVRPPDF